jgi:metal-sulfur cluster biosynthetic enzyme
VNRSRTQSGRPEAAARHPEEPEPSQGPVPTVDRLWSALREVEDPELPVSLVDMGLIISIEYVAVQKAARLRITYTAMGCPAMDMIQDDIRARLLREPDVDRVDIDVVWDPIWTHRRLSPAARASMRELGLAV